MSLFILFPRGLAVFAGLLALNTLTATTARCQSSKAIDIPTLGSAGTEKIEDDLDVLLDGVAEIGVTGVPSPLCVYGSEAFPVIVGRVSYTSRGFPVSGTIYAPVAAASRWQAGRIVALGHEGYFKRATLDTGRLIMNALHWAAGEIPSRPRIGVVGNKELHMWLKESGHDVVECLGPDSLKNVDVVVCVMWDQSIPQIDALSAFVRNGGGLVTAANGWDWAHRHPTLDLINDFPGNRLLAPVGIQWANAHLSNTSPGGYLAQSPPGLTHTGTALEAIEAHVTGARTLTEPEIDQALESLALTAYCIPVDDNLLAPRLHALLESDERGPRWPSAEQPIVKTNVIGRLSTLLFMLEQSRTSPESVRAHPMAADFPGEVPDDAPRIVRSLTINTAIPRWHSTGLYAAPGERVTVTVPTEVAASGNFHVRVGAHTDKLWHLSQWKRMPEISRHFLIATTKTFVANAFGGLIYIEVPNNADLGSIVVKVQGAVAAPLFVLGETDPAAWRDEIRHAPAPWAEIAGRNIIVTTDALEVRNLDDPTALAETWDRILDLSAELASWAPNARSSPERFVVDRQISVGYMHAGYPLMAHLDQKKNLVNLKHLRSEGNWGFFHEIGHNHQAFDWTFDGTVNVTGNLFSSYIYEFLCGIPAAENWRAHPAFRDYIIEGYNFNNPNFEQWKRKPSQALVMYEQMQQAFGWDAYREIFATYRALPYDERPKNDDEKRDQWLVRFSQQVGHNLGPFFQAWGVPTSQDARDSIADLPVWMPPDFPPQF